MKYSGEGFNKLWTWFGLSRASFLVLPRVLLHEMPDEWQLKMSDLLEEMYTKFGDIENYNYSVRVLNDNGKIIKTPEWLTNYRHPEIPTIKLEEL